MTFACLDFETANYSRVSICAAGIAVFEGANLAESHHWLVRPPKGHGYFREDFTEIHGLTWTDIQDAPEFPAIASELLERLTRSDIVIAHNAKFDIGVLQATLDHFGLSCPEFHYLCTYRVAERIWPDLPNHRLNNLAEHIGHEFHHHNAQADAEAAGRVLLAMMKHANATTPRQLLQKAGLEPKRVSERNEPSPADSALLTKNLISRNTTRRDDDCREPPEGLSTPPQMQSDPNNFQLTLKEIASWQDIPELTDTPEVRASIPVLQRGLVWNPAQIELLWDSILRGFPIGALVLSAKIDGQEKKADQQKLVTHHLLDGQQRCDAIALGFKDPFREPGTQADTKVSESILWLDVNPAKDEWTTREFLVRLTTTSHPWGYARNDSAAPLGASAIRDALDLIGANPAAKGYKRPTPEELFPNDAVAPIPLSWLLLSTKNGTDIWDDIKNRLDRSIERHWHKPLRDFMNGETGKDQRDIIQGAIKRTRSARIVALCAPSDLLDGSRQERATSREKPQISSIEHLFQRLNQQGTVLDGEELAYSMIKAYWPQLAEPIDRIPKLLPATRLISLAIRAALSNQDRNQLPNALGVSGIRNMARKHDEKTKLVHDYINEELGLALGCKQIEAWLRYDKANNPSGLLPVHIASIARESPDIFLLLLTFVKRPATDWEHTATGWPKHLQALSTLTQWFGRNKGNIANRVFAACADRISLANVRQALSEALQHGDIRQVHPPAVVENFVQVQKEDLEHWNWESQFQREGPDKAKELSDSWAEFLWFREQREMLLYAQREYIHDRFADYDPARKDYWKGHNRPWDFDHICAWMYVNNRKDGGPYREIAKEWAKTIGNLRAWPFEDNRSDQADLALNKLSGDEGEKKRFNSFLDDDELAAFSGGDKVRWEHETAHAFVTACRRRMLRIYRTWYESVDVAEMLTTAEGARSIARPSQPTTIQL